METSEVVTTTTLTFDDSRRKKKTPNNRSCEFCGMVFKARTTLYKHMLKLHPQEWSMKQIKKQMERQFQCKFCHCKFRYKNNLSSHTKKVHKVCFTAEEADIDLGSIADGTKRKSHLNYCKEDDCSESFLTIELLKQHLTKEHFIHIENTQMTFKTYNDFEEWRKGLERNTTRFMPRMKWPRADGGFSRLFKCMRSGVYSPTVSEENRKRRLKLEGSYKIGQHCPAQLTVVSYPNGVTKVKACLTHYGHEFNGKYTYGYNKNKTKKKKRDYVKQEYSVVYSEQPPLKQDHDHEVLTSSLATRENLRDQAKDLCGFLQGLLTTTEVGEDNLADIIMNLNNSVSLAGWKSAQESEFVPVDVVHSVREIEAHEQAPVHRIVTDSSKYNNRNKYDQQQLKPKLEQQEVVQEYLITEAPCEQYILWA